jgi:glycosyltransferase involved in cell wall biosynthesis
MSNRFVFIVPMYNASETLEQMLLSVVGQSYKKWKIVLIDDMSDQVHLDKCKEIVQRYKTLINDDVGMNSKIALEINHSKQWEVSNVLFGMLQYCKDDDIVCRLDGDDWLTDLDTLAILDKRYDEKKVDVIWTAHRWSFSDMNISNRLPTCEDPYTYPWVSSHFKTFKYKLLKNVPIENFYGPTGEFIKRTGDQAIYLPALLNSKGNWHFEPRVTYHYTIDLDHSTFQTEDAKFQKEEGEFIRRRGYVAVGKPWEQCFEVRT